MAAIRTPDRALRGLALVLSLLASACSGSSGGGGSFSIVSCSLGCSSSGSGSGGQVSCGIANVFVNGDLRLVFSQPVDEASLSVFTLQVSDAATGKTPTAERFVDPNDPQVVVYRPSLTFDSSGTPSFGLTAGASYTLKLPGTAEDPGSNYIQSQDGQPNQHRMLCTLDASLGILDPKPGAPTATPTVDVVTAYDPVSGEPSEIAEGVFAQGAVDVYRFSSIEIAFDDLMNPATLVNPVEGTSSTLAVLVDPDGDTTDTSDQVPLAGSWSIQIDQDALSTAVTFEPAIGLPSAGSDALSPRKIIVTLAPSISDLGGTSVANPEPITFTPEQVIFPETALTEEFLNPFLEDDLAGGADWGGAQPGFLRPGLGGGSGRHGRLELKTGEQYTLNTDFEDFSGLTSEQWDPAGAPAAVFDGTSFTVDPVTDGVFEFSYLRVRQGAVLRLVGSNPARIFVRGVADIEGTVDASGAPGFDHFGGEIFGAASATPGPNGGPGGAGGRLTTWENFESFPGVIVPKDPLVLPPTLAELNGAEGAGVPDNVLAPTGSYGAGAGGIAWPQPTPAHPTFHLPVDKDDIDGLELDSLLLCSTKMKGSVGAGAGFGLDGGAGKNGPVPGGFLPATEPPLSAPGQAADFGLGIGSDPASPQRTLDPEEGWLHGGPGGGGGGSHILFTRTDGQILADCFTKLTGGAAEIALYGQSSSAAGGAGGGALQLQAGRVADIDGRLLASGGSGGGKSSAGNSTSGGGGAGGALLLQGASVTFAGAPGRLSVEGGEGGFGTGGSFGGDGGAGVIRVEQGGAPIDLTLLSSVSTPNEDALALVGATPSDVFSSGVLTPKLVGPNGISGAQSCWLRPEGVYFTLDFQADGAELGWDMSILPNPPGLGEQSFRGENDLFAQPLEDVFGNELGTSPVVVLFQGVRIVDAVSDLCSLQLTGEEAPVAPGSLTGWVSHPAELNTYFADPGLRSNAIRFAVLFDETLPAADAITAVSEVWIRAQAD